MAETTAISWTDATVNFWQGCRKVSPGCLNCYMYRDKKRYGQNPEDIRRSSNGTFYKPLKWGGKKVFVCSWSDFFIKEADTWRSDAWEVIRKTPSNTYQILTKRPERIADCLPDDWPLKNVWLGVTVENQDCVYRIDEMTKTEATLYFVSAEPLLSNIDFGSSLKKVDWVIVGGESGPEHRIVDLRWVLDIKNQCDREKVPFFFKQWGTNRKCSCHGVYGCCLLNGKLYQNFPAVP